MAEKLSRTKKMLRVLLVEDSKDDAELVLNFLKQGGYTLKWQRVETAAELTKALAQNVWDIIYADYSLPNFDGLQALKLVREKRIEIPFIIISGKMGEEFAVEAMKAGADDYLMKDRLSRLAPATNKILQEYHMRRRFEITEKSLRELEERLSIIFDKSLDVIMIIDGKTGEILSVNQSCKSLLGYESKDLLGKHFSVLFPPRQKLDEDGFADKVRTYGSIFESQEFLRADGSICPMDLSATLIPCGEGKAILATLRDVSERLKFEEELRMSEIKYRLLVENASEAIVVAQNGMFKFVNAKTVEITGYAEEELLDRPFAEIIHPDDRKMVVERYLGRIKGKKIPPVYSFRIIDKQGTTKWMEINAVLVNWEGEPATLNFLNDISDRKRAEEALKESEKKYRQIVDNSVVGIYITQKHILKFCNQRLADMFGYKKPQEMIGLHVRKIIAPESWDLVDEQVKLRETGKKQSIEYEFRGIKKDGTIIDVVALGVRIFYEGEPAIQGTMIDLTERKRAEKALIESENRYRSIVENSYEGIFIVDDKYNFVYANEQLCKILGYTNEEIIGTDFRKYLDEESKKLVIERYIKRQKGEYVPNRYEFNVVRKGGKKRRVEISSAVVRDTQGKPRTIAQILDITDRKRSESIQSVLYSISQATTRSDNLDELLETIHQQLGLLIDTTNFYIALYNENEGSYSFPYCVDEFKEKEIIAPEEMQKSLTDYVRRTGIALLADQKIHQQLIKDGSVEMVGRPTKIWMGVPLKIPGGIIGVVAVQSYRDEAHYSQQDLELMTFISGHIAMAIHRKRAEDQLKASLKEKEILLKEIHHRVKNNLQVVSSLLYLQSKYLKDEDALKIFLESRNRIRTMSLVHEKLYRSTDLAQINFSDYIKDLVSYLFRSLQIDPSRIKLKKNVENVLLSVDSAIPCGLIINELVSNAFKHAFTDDRKGEITINLRAKKNGRYVLLVKDNGVGLPDDSFLEKKKSLGLQLVKTLVDQLMGEMTINRTNGTAFSIAFCDEKKYND